MKINYLQELNIDYKKIKRMKLISFRMKKGACKEYYKCLLKFENLVDLS